MTTELHAIFTRATRKSPLQWWNSAKMAVLEGRAPSRPVIGKIFASGTANQIKRLAGYILMLVGLGATTAWGQAGLGTPILRDAGGSQLEEERIDARLGQRPISQEDRTLKTGRELKQGEAVVAIRPPPPKPAADSPRVRAAALLEEDRARVKREAALME